MAHIREFLTDSVLLHITDAHHRSGAVHEHPLPRSIPIHHVFAASVTAFHVAGDSGAWIERPRGNISTGETNVIVQSTFQAGDVRYYDITTTSVRLTWPKPADKKFPVYAYRISTREVGCGFEVSNTPYKSTPADAREAGHRTFSAAVQGSKSSPRETLVPPSRRWWIGARWRSKPFRGS